MLISKENSILVVIDIQEALNPVMLEPRLIIKYSTNLLKIANLLKIPYIVSEHAPEKLGPTIIDIKQEINENNIISKTNFSCCNESDFMKKLSESKKKQVIITGIESHICILQTAISLKEQGFKVFVVVDAISSRKELDYKTACSRIKQNNINLITYEMLVFEWLKDANHPDFKNIRKNFIDRN